MLAPFLLLFGLFYGIAAWRRFDGERSAGHGRPGDARRPANPARGAVLLSWLHFDVAAEPRQPVHPLLESSAERRSLDPPE